MYMLDDDSQVFVIAPNSLCEIRMGPNFKMITIIICEFGAIELQRTLVIWLNSVTHKFTDR